MIIYNVTIVVDWSIAESWVKWMKEEHIPDVMGTECFTSFTFCRLLELEDLDGPTYTCQYFAESKANYNRYLELHSVAMRQSGIDRWQDKFMAFRTLMQVVQ